MIDFYAGQTRRRGCINGLMQPENVLSVFQAALIYVKIRAFQIQPENDFQAA